MSRDYHLRQRRRRRQEAVNSERTLEWQFGGCSGLPSWLCWIALLLLAAGGIALAFQFYRHTLRALTWRQRVIFATLRCGFLLSLLLCLAGPARVERVYDADQDARPLAVIVDRSGSMNVADSLGTTRVSHALRVWKKVEADAIRSFPSLRYFHFSQSLATSPDLETAMTALLMPGDEYASLADFRSTRRSSDAPPGGYGGGIVCLTDGLDTTRRH